MTRTPRWPLPILLTSLLIGAGLTSGCQLALSEPVGMGVARLTVRNAGAITALIADDTGCGFGNAGVLEAATLTGEVGSVGKHTLQVVGCEIDLGEATVISESCDGGQLLGAGRITIDATREIEGILTGNPDQPVTPVDPDSTVITVTATFENFTIKAGEEDPNFLTHNSGGLSFRARPRLAALYDFPGICGFPTPNVSFSQLAHTDAELTLTSAQVPPMAVAVADSSLRAQVGLGADEESENSISGTIEVWDINVSIPTADEDGQLDPGYDRQAWIDSYATCVDEESAMRPLEPLTFVCPGIDRLLAIGTAQLAVAHLSTITSLVEQDASCGFASPDALAQTTVEGGVGELGTATTTLSECTLSFAGETVVQTWCNGDEVAVSGSVTVSGTRTLTGVVTDDPQRPVLATSDNALVFEFTRIEFTDFLVRTTARDETLVLNAGRLEGRVLPRTAAAAADGSCSVLTPVARYEDLTFRSATGQMITEQLTANLDMATSSIQALSGTWGPDSNDLAGSIDMNGTSYGLGATSGGSLQLGYVQTEFDELWQCGEGLAQPVAFACASAP